MAYIDRDKFRMHIIMYQHNPLKVRLTDKEKEKFIRMLDEVPPADVVERKRGKWERHFLRPNVYADMCWHCSVCGGSFADNWANKWNFCPKCGSDNREESDNG